MGPARTGSKRGAFQIDRQFPGIGRIKRSSGTNRIRDFERRNALLTKLYEQSALVVLRAFKDGRITMQQIVEADRGGNAAISLERIALTDSLPRAIERALPAMAKSPATRDRYKRSLEKLLNTLPTLQMARVGDLGGVDWRSLDEKWGTGAADWNHMRRAVSRFLSVHLGDKYHPQRRAVVMQIAQKKETPRTPDQSPELFVRITQTMPEPAKDVFLTMALTGMRIGEYMYADKSALLPELHGVRVSGKQGDGIVYLPPEVFAIVSRSIPCPFGPTPEPHQPTHKIKRYGVLYRLWQKHQRIAGVSPRLTLHDIRHLFAQTSSDEGTPTAETQAALRHTDPRMTRRYELPAQALRATTAVARRFGITVADPEARRKRRA